MQNQGVADANLRERLLASASELGISEEAALAAQEQWENQQKERALLADYRAHIKREFQMHFAAYVVVNIVLILINRLTSHYPWAIWPILGWGIGFGVHAAVTWIQLKNPGGPEFESWRRRREGKDPEPEDLGHRVYGVGIHVHAAPKAPLPPKPPSDI